MIPGPRVLQWYVLCGIPYRGEGHLPRLALRTGFSSPLMAGSQATLRSSTAFEQLSESITSHSHLQALCLFFLDTSKTACNRCSLILYCFFAALACLQAARPCVCNFLRIATGLKHCKAFHVENAAYAVEMTRSGRVARCVSTGLTRVCGELRI
jgi:hypothetical protein